MPENNVPDTAGFYPDFAKAFGGAVATQQGTLPHAEWNTGAGDSAPVKMAKSFSECKQMMSYEEQKTWHKRALPFLAQKFGTTNVDPMLVSSISPRMPFIVNPEAPLVEFMNGPGPLIPVTDYVHRIVERRQGSEFANQFNPEKYPLDTTETPTLRTQVDSVLAFWGEHLTVPIVTQSVVNQQPQAKVDLLRQEVDSKILAIKRSKNRDFWNGTEQKMYAPASSVVATVGGLTTRIFSNIYDCGGLDISQALLETGVNALGQKIGWRTLKVIFCDINNVSPIELIGIDKYQGQNYTSFKDFEERSRGLFGNMLNGVTPDRFYESSLGGTIAVIHDKDLVNQLVMITVHPDYIPREAHFLLGGEPGAWVIGLPVYGAVEAKLVFDGSAIDDPGEETRAYFKNAT